MLHRGWKRVDGKLVETRTVHVHAIGEEDTKECLVEFKKADGQTVRLKVTARRTVRMPSKGGTVPLLVKPDDSKAVIDTDDPRINVNKIVKARERAEKDRFDSQSR